MNNAQGFLLGIFIVLIFFVIDFFFISSNENSDTGSVKSNVVYLDFNTPKGKELWSQIVDSSFREMTDIYGQPNKIYDGLGGNFSAKWGNNLIMRQKATGWWCNLSTEYTSSGKFYNWSLEFCKPTKAEKL